MLMIADHTHNSSHFLLSRTALLDSPLVVSNPFPNTIIQEHLTENTGKLSTFVFLLMSLSLLF